MSVDEQADHAVGLFDAVGQGGARGNDVRGARERRFGLGPQARDGRAQIVRDVVERAAHAFDERLDARDHLVEHAAQLVHEIAVGRSHGDARAQLTGARDRVHGVAQLAQGPQRLVGDRGAAHEPDGHDDDDEQAEQSRTSPSRRSRPIVVRPT